MTFLKRPTAILFDWDNTLVDTWPVIFEAMTYTFKTMGKTPWTLEETKERVHRSMRDAFPDIFKERWEEAGAIYQQRFREIHLEKLRALEGAELVLQSIQTLPVLKGIVSNKTNVNLHKEVAHLGWKKYFDVVVGAQDAARDKPFADPILYALKESGIPANDQVWLIGDSVTDLECAKNAGITAVFFGATRENAAESLQVFEPKFWIENHEGLKGLMGRIT